MEALSHKTKHITKYPTKVEELEEIRKESVLVFCLWLLVGIFPLAHSLPSPTSKTW